MPTTGSLALYIHIPFCRKQCPYCDFSTAPNGAKERIWYLRALRKECSHYHALLERHTISSIYFGGGTPSLFPKACQVVLDYLSQFSWKRYVEITFEMNVEDLQEGLLHECSAMGINRLSLGVQTWEKKLLRLLGREAIQEGALDLAYRLIPHLSIDLMYAIPGQTEEEIRRDLENVPKAPISHISLYNLTIAPDSLLAKEGYREEESKLTTLQIYQNTLEMHGYKRYEISGFAHLGKEAVQNAHYWTGKPYLGLGASSHSYYGNTRWQNTPSITGYCQSWEKSTPPISHQESLPLKERQKELLALGLRLLKGICLTTFTKREGTLLPEVTKRLFSLEQEGWIVRRQNQIFLSAQGIEWYDHVAATLIEHP